MVGFRSRGLPKPDPPDIGAFFEIGPLAPRTASCFELKAQRLWIVIDDQLQRPVRTEAIEQLKRNSVTMLRIDVPQRGSTALICLRFAASIAPSAH